MICNHNRFPLTPASPAGAAQLLSTQVWRQEAEAWQVQGCKTPPPGRSDWMEAQIHTRLLSAPRKEKFCLCLQNNIRAARPKHPKPADICPAVTETCPGLFVRHEQLGRALCGRLLAEQ